MSLAVRKAEQALFAFAAKHPHARSIPHHLQQALDTINRYHQAQEVAVNARLSPQDLEAIADELKDGNEERFKRRVAEARLADYIEEIHHATGWRPEPKKRVVKGEVKWSRPRTLEDIAASLRTCRKTGLVGLKPEGGYVMAWDEKCGQVRLCPDESREETQRLSEWYEPAMYAFAKASPTHRLFYLVPTLHNYRPGDLARGKRELMERWKQFSADLVAEGIGLEGSLNIQEDPLSARGDWNVHLNCFACVRGRFDYARVRELWGANIHIEQIKGDREAIRNALREAIKYAAQIVPTKSEDKAERDDSDAPAMTEWPHDRWLEWWQAQQGFRRVRSYGCLYGLHEKRWKAASGRQRRTWCDQAEQPAALARLAWREIDAKQRDPLRKAMVHGERLSMGAIQWIGSIIFDAAGSYAVGLTPGNNFSPDSREKPNRAAAPGHQRAPP